MNKKQKFENFLESLKGKDQDALIESVKSGFQACYEGVEEDYDDDDDDSRNYEDERYRMDFEKEGSALRKSTRSNPRNLPCPTCGEPDKLTAKDKANGYQCDDCADRAEGGGY